MEANSGKSVCKQYVIHNLLLYLCFEFRIEYDCNYLSTIIYTVLTDDKETLAEAMGKERCLNCETETIWWYGCLNTDYCTRCARRRQRSFLAYFGIPKNYKIKQNQMYMTCCLSEECPLKQMFGYQGGSY